MPLHRMNLPARPRAIWTHQTESVVKRHKCRAPGALESCGWIIAVGNGIRSTLIELLPE